VDFIINPFFFANPERSWRAGRSFFGGIITELQGRVYNVAVSTIRKSGSSLPGKFVYG